MFLTLAFSLVLHVQVGVPLAFGLQQRALVLVGLPVGAADGPLPGDVGAVRGANAARLAPPVHLAPLPGAAVHVVAGLCKSRGQGYECALKWTHDSDEALRALLPLGLLEQRNGEKTKGK